jgi:hypothetical protein
MGFTSVALLSVNPIVELALIVVIQGRSNNKQMVIECINPLNPKVARPLIASNEKTSHWRAGRGHDPRI